MKCFDLCRKCDVPCDVKDCRQWIDYEEDLNCTIVAVNKRGPMTLREVSERLGVSFVRIKQIQDKLVEKLSKNKFT